MANLDQNLTDPSSWLSAHSTKLDTLPQLVLSSSSPARRELLARLQIPFVSVAPHIDETPLPGEPVASMVLRLAEQKAKKPAHLYSNAHIIGCDQVGIVDDILLGKPITYENAMSQLRLMSGKKVTFYTAIYLWSTKTQECQQAIEIYDVYLRLLTDNMIATYLQKEQVLQCAGSIHVEGLGISLINTLEGNDYTALIGLPLIRLTNMLETVGFNVL